MAGVTPDLVPLGIAELRLSRLCFGTGTLFRLHSSRIRQRLLDAAYDLGIRHFDTARSYGLGDAEREVGRFLARHRDDVTVATKFGMQASRTGRILKPLQTAARRIVGIFPGLRKQLRKRPLPIVSQRCFDVASARASLETSLRELAVERIDVLFLHEPDARSVIEPALSDWLAASRDAGMIRAWGLSGPLPSIRAVQTARPLLAQIMQYASDLCAQPALAAAWHGPRIVYSPFARVLEPVMHALTDSATGSAEWRRSLDLPVTKDSVVGMLLVAACSQTDPCPVLFSTTSTRHLESLVQSARDPAMHERVTAFSKWFASNIGNSSCEQST